MRKEVNKASTFPSQSILEILIRFLCVRDIYISPSFGVRLDSTLLYNLLNYSEFEHHFKGQVID